MSFFDDVTPQNVEAASDGFLDFKIGDNEAFIKMAYEEKSKSGNPMLTIVFANREGAEIKYYIANNEYKLQRLKQLYIAFGIPMGNNEIEDWRGKKGIVVCKLGEPYKGRTYPKVSYVRPLIAKDIPEKRSTEPGYSPQGQGQSSDNFADDIPF